MSVFPPLLRNSFCPDLEDQLTPSFEQVLKLCQALALWEGSDEVESVLVRKYALLPTNAACEVFLSGLLRWLNEVSVGDANAVEDAIRCMHLYASLAATHPRKWVDAIDTIGFSTDVLDLFLDPHNYLARNQFLYYPKFGEMQAAVTVVVRDDEK